MKNVGAVLLTGDLKYSEVPPPPIREGEVLVKVLSAALTPTDVAAARGRLPYAYGKVVGSAGLVRVVELGHGVTGLAVGENAVVSPRCFVELALYRNGVMAEQASLDSRCLEPVPQSLTGIAGLNLSLFAHLPQVVSLISGSTMLIAGCGYEAHALTALVKDVIRVEALCSSERGLQRIAKLGIRAHLREGSGGDFDVVYIASLDPYVNSVAVRRCGESLYVSPLVPDHLVPLGSGVRRVLSGARLRPNIAEALSIVRKAGRDIESVFRVVESLRAVAESARYYGHLAYVASPEPGNRAGR